MSDRPPRKNSLKGQDGQALLLGVLMASVLLVMAPFLTEFLRLRTGWSASSAQANQALRAAYAGISRACRLMQADQTQTTWNNARGWNSNYAGVAPAGFSSGSPVAIGGSNATFSLQLNTQMDYNGIGLGVGPRYTTEICSTGRYKSAARALHAGLRARGFGVRLPNGQNIYPALMLSHDPGAATMANLSVYWGPIVSYSGLTLAGDSDITHSPRKFAAGAITPRKTTTNAPVTDGQEYWAFSKLGTPPVINEAQYQAWANGSPTIYGTGNLPSGSVLDGNAYCPGANIDACVYGFIQGWSGGGGLYGGQYDTPSIYVAGNATVGFVQVRANGFIVTGDAVFDNTKVATNFPSMCGGSWCDTEMAYPGDLWKEYPQGFNGSPFPGWSSGMASYYNASCSIPGNAAYPCPTTFNPGGAMSTTSGIGGIPANRVADIRGFVYVKGDLTIHNGNWIINGALRVDGTLTIDSTAHLYVLADDMVIHNIQVTPLKVEPAYIREIVPGQFHPTT